MFIMCSHTLNNKQTSKANEQIVLAVDQFVTKVLRKQLASVMTIQSKISFRDGLHGTVRIQCEFMTHSTKNSSHILNSFVEYSISLTIQQGQTKLKKTNDKEVSFWAFSETINGTTNRRTSFLKPKARVTWRSLETEIKTWVMQVGGLLFKRQYALPAKPAFLCWIAISSKAQLLFFNNIVRVRPRAVQGAVTI